MLMGGSYADRIFLCRYIIVAVLMFIPQHQRCKVVCNSSPSLRLLLFRSSKTSVMYYTATSALSITATSSANGFAIFTTTISPREAYTAYEDLHVVFRSADGSYIRERKSSTVKSGLKKLFGGL
jgi:hypothetical protein